MTLLFLYWICRHFGEFIYLFGIYFVQYLDKYYLILGTVRGTLFIRIMRLFSVTVGPETTSFIHEREDHDGYTGISVPALFSELIRRKSEAKKPYVLKEETRE